MAVLALSDGQLRLRWARRRERDGARCHGDGRLEGDSVTDPGPPDDRTHGRVPRAREPEPSRTEPTAAGPGAVEPVAGERAAARGGDGDGAGTRAAEGAASADGDRAVPADRDRDTAADRDRAVAGLRALPPPRRLALRRDPLLAACVSGELLVRSLELLDDLVDGAGPEHAARYAELACAFARARRFDPGGEPRFDRRAALALAGVLARAFAHDLGEAGVPRPGTPDFPAQLDAAARAGDLGAVRGLGAGLRPLTDAVTAKAVADHALPGPAGLVDALLTGVLDDFTGADLRGVHPADPALTGIRWSDTTKWPLGTDIAALRTRSTETEPFSRVYVLGGRSGPAGATGAHGAGGEG